MKILIGLLLLSLAFAQLDEIKFQEFVKSTVSTLSREKLMGAHALLSPFQSPETAAGSLHMLLKNCDQDNDMMMTQSEITVCLNFYFKKLGITIGDDHTEAIMRICDEDKDGKINAIETYTKFVPLMKRIDDAVQKQLEDL